MGYDVKNHVMFLSFFAISSHFFNKLPRVTMDKTVYYDFRPISAGKNKGKIIYDIFT